MRDKLIEFLDNPTSRIGRGIALAIIGLIYFSIVQVVIEMRYPSIATAYPVMFKATGNVILAVFSLELVVRLACYRKPLRYLASFNGAVDLLAVVPGLLGLVFPISSDTQWLRVLRLLRLGRSLKFARSGKGLGGVTGRLAPFFAVALGFKGLMTALEGMPWWPTLDNLTVVIGVAGFALAILLGTKLRVITGRFYAIEDAICRIVGSLRDMWAAPPVQNAIAEWSSRFEQVLLDPSETKIQRIKNRTDDLEQTLEARGIGGPVTAGLHRDIEFVLHRVTARTPPSYEIFLRNVTIAYVAVVVLAIPGLTGFFASALIIYVLGGMYLLIDDMDKPLDFSRESMVAVDLTPLKSFNQGRAWRTRQDSNL